jgi:hypothetical protein
MVLMLVVPHLEPPVVHAAPSDYTLVTYNMQGAEGKWENVARLALKHNVISLQEAGSPPATAQLQQTVLTNGWDVEVYFWYTNRVGYWFYYLKTDLGAMGSDNNGRVNLAMVTDEQAQTLTVISPQAPVGRPALGVLLRNTDWFFTFHALASGGGDAGTMAQAVSQYINVNNTSSLHPKWGWTILGDWNRIPGSWDPPSDSFIYKANHATHQGGKELDYMVSSYQMAGYQGRVMNGMSSDHYPVEFGFNLE